MTNPMSAERRQDIREQAEAWEGHVLGAWDGEFPMESGLDNAVLKTARLLKESLAEIDRLSKELEPYEVLNPQQCPKGLHADWLVDSENTHACPWCRIAELERPGLEAKRN